MMPLRTLQVAALLLSGHLAHANDWPSWRMDSTLCGYTEASVPASPRLLWRTRIGHPIENSPVGRNGRTFVTTTGGTVACVDKRGKLLWTRAFTNDAGSRLNFASSAVCGSNAVFACTDDGNVYALDVETGAMNWSTKLEATVFAPPEWVSTATGARLYIIDQPSGTLHCVQAENGQVIWSTEGEIRTDGPISISDNHIVFGSCDSMVHIISRTNGQPIGTIELGEGNEIAGGIALKADQAFTGNRSGDLVCVDINKHRTLWTHSDASGQLFTTPAISSDRVVTVTADGDILCLNRTDGTKLWSIAAEASEQSSPVIAKERVVVCFDGTILIVQLADGAETWRQTISDTITPPAIIDGMIIVGTDEGDLLAFGKQNNR